MEAKMVNIKRLIMKPMIRLRIEAYRQGKEDFEKGEFDESEFEKQMEKLINSQF